MKPLRTRLREAAFRMRVSQMVVEKDYALSYLLAGVAANPDLSGTLIFKGGTALKKLYFGDYRFSEDLDFSTKGAELSDLLKRKSGHRGVSYKSLDDFFTAELEAEARRNWDVDTPTAGSGGILASPRTACRGRSYIRSTSV